MAIKYYPIPEKRQMVAVLSNCKYDAYNKIDKMLHETGFCFSPNGTKTYNKYMMPDTFKVVVTCDPRDEYSIEEGKRVAKIKVMRNYHKSMDKRIASFKENVASMISMVAASNKES